MIPGWVKDKTLIDKKILVFQVALQEEEWSRQVQINRGRRSRLPLSILIMVMLLDNIDSIDCAHHVDQVEHLDHVDQAHHDNI